MWPAFLLLAGLSAESWYLRGTRVALRMQLDARLKLGRPAPAAFAFEHNRGRELVLQYARVLRCRPTPRRATRPSSCRCGWGRGDSAKYRRDC
jgi:hypothetical protein